MGVCNFHTELYITVVFMYLMCAVFVVLGFAVFLSHQGPPKLRAVCADLTLLFGGDSTGHPLQCFSFSVCFIDFSYLYYIGLVLYPHASLLLFHRREGLKSATLQEGTLVR